MARDYRKEYDNYHSSDKQKKNRAGRNLARRMMKKRVGIKGKDVHHKDCLLYTSPSPRDRG